jgi:hypothetical protein
MMSKNLPLVFSGIVAYILLLLYAGTVLHMAKDVVQHGASKPITDKEGKEVPKQKFEFPTGVVYVVTTVGGLVSALVIARLAITKPGEIPALMRTEDASEQAKSLMAWLTSAYMLGWLATGFTALVVGVMVYPDSNTTLGEIGTNWLGLAVASGYAYFGLSPSKS